MKIIANDVCHIYNQGNNKQIIFFEHDDYIYFLQLVRKTISPHCRILAYCLMPNHFHFLILTTDASAELKRIGNIETTNLANGFRLLLSTYAQYINKRQRRSGSVFRQRSKAKSLVNGTHNNSAVAFNYIHQNPLRAGLVGKLEDWQYSSYLDYAGLRQGTICDQKLARDLVGINYSDFKQQSSLLV